MSKIPAKEVPEYRVDDLETTWEKFQTLAQKALATPAASEQKPISMQKAKE